MDLDDGGIVIGALEDAVDLAEALRRREGDAVDLGRGHVGPRVVVSQDGGRETPRWREAKEEILAAKSYLAKKCGPALAPMRVVVHLSLIHI